jgi:hypothetical protein
MIGDGSKTGNLFKSLATIFPENKDVGQIIQANLLNKENRLPT